MSYYEISTFSLSESKRNPINVCSLDWDKKWIYSSNVTNGLIFWFHRLCTLLDEP
jgi:hypothetical protein